MKDYKLKLIILMILILSTTNITSINATPGKLKGATLITCPDGIKYGQHSSDDHWHVAGNNDSATGSALAGHPCPVQEEEEVQLAPTQEETELDLENQKEDWIKENKDNIEVTLELRIEDNNGIITTTELNVDNDYKYVIEATETDIDKVVITTDISIKLKDSIENTYEVEFEHNYNENNSTIELGLDKKQYKQNFDVWIKDSKTETIDEYTIEIEFQKEPKFSITISSML